MNHSIEHWQYLHGRPGSTGELKLQAEDFIVEEHLSFVPSGEGEHVFLYIEKQNLNTGFVAQTLAKHYQRKERDVAYAGRKDKFATTRQWFSIYLPGKNTSMFPPFQQEGCRILEESRHNKKLRLGAIKENHFEIRIHNCVLDKDFEHRIQHVAHVGVPNYFGSQRFGLRHEDGRYGNLALAELLIQGDDIRKRDKRSMAISALRSWLFNECLSRRIQAQHFAAPLPGDTFILQGSNSFFTADDIDQEIESRLASDDIQCSAPLWGAGPLPCRNEALALEQGVADAYPEICETLARLGLKQERRATRLLPQRFHHEIEKNSVKLQFSLPSGCFATSVIRELFSNIS